MKRALEVAAAGGHNVLMSGPPGAGKTALARSLPSVLPSTLALACQRKYDLTEALEVTRIHSVAGTLPGDVLLICHWPCRAPYPAGHLRHHTILHAGLVCGGPLAAAVVDPHLWWGRR